MQYSLTRKKELFLQAKKVLVLNNLQSLINLKKIIKKHWSLLRNSKVVKRKSLSPNSVSMDECSCKSHEI